MSSSTVAKQPGLPAYAQMMADYHRAFERELKGVVSALPIREGDCVVDLACGDGSYSRWLAERVGAQGRIRSIDVSAEFLDLARRSVRSTPVDECISFIQADLDHLPLDEGKSDLVWCAQSLYSLPEPVEAVRRMHHLARPGGCVAVLESDEFHHVLLPWPIELEAASKKAELAAYRAEAGDERKYYIGRSLPRVFRKAGMPRCEVRAFAFHRQAPLDDPTRGFLAGYLEDLRGRVAPRLGAEDRECFESLADPDSSPWLNGDPDFGFTCLEHLVTAVKP